MPSIRSRQTLVCSVILAVAALLTGACERTAGPAIGSRPEPTFWSVDAASTTLSYRSDEDGDWKVWVAAIDAYRLQAGRSVRTGAAGEAILTTGANRLVLGPRTSVALGVGPQQLRQTAGVVTYRLKAGRKERFQVTTKDHLISGRAATFEVRVQPDRELIRVHDGEVVVAERAGGALATLRAGERHWAIASAHESVGRPGPTDRSPQVTALEPVPAQEPASETSAPSVVASVPADSLDVDSSAAVPHPETNEKVAAVVSIEPAASLADEVTITLELEADAEPPAVITPGVPDEDAASALKQVAPDTEGAADTDVQDARPAKKPKKTGPRLSMTFHVARLDDGAHAQEEIHAEDSRHSGATAMVRVDPTTTRPTDAREIEKSPAIGEPERLDPVATPSLSSLPEPTPLWALDGGPGPAF
ncbi:MAG: hypothetical protein ACFB6S_03225 [Geminicoccaceae bacterium]